MSTGRKREGTGDRQVWFLALSRHVPQHLIAQRWYFWYIADLKGQLCFDTPEFQAGPQSSCVPSGIPKDPGPSLVCCLILVTRIFTLSNEWILHIPPHLILLHSEPWVTHLSRHFTSLHSGVHRTESLWVSAPSTSPWLSGSLCWCLERGPDGQQH